MNISPDMLTLLNRQMGHELDAMRFYLAMSSFYLNEELNGFAAFFRTQSEEEHQHAMRLFDYLHDVGGRLVLSETEAPANDFSSVQDALERSLKHEQEVTQHIYRIMEQSLAENDYATHTFMQWFVSEQVEEESTLTTLLSKAKRVKNDSSALYLLDDELKRRAEAANNA